MHRDPLTGLHIGDATKIGAVFPTAREVCEAPHRHSVDLIGARVLPIELPVAKAVMLFDADGRLIDDELRVRLSEVVSDLVAAAQERQAVQAAS